MDHDQEQKRRNPDLYDAYQKAKLAFTIGRAVPLVWITIITIAGIVLFSAAIGISTGTQGAGSEGTANPAENTQVIAGLFNIKGATQTEIQTVNDALSIGFSYPGYKKRLTSNVLVNITFQQNPTWQGGQVDGLTLAGDEIIIRSGLPLDKLKYTILHETGHIIIFRGRVYQQYSLSDLRQADSDCYSSLDYLKTYSFANTGGGGGESVESFAESVSQFLLSRPPLENFSMLCPNTYNWMLKNVFQKTQ